MKHNQHIDRAKNKATKHRAYNGQQGRILLACLIVLGSVVVAGIAVTAVVWTAQQLKPPQDTEVGIMAVVATVTLLAILGQILITVLQWQAMRDALEHSKQVFAIGERAYIGLGAIRVKTPIDAIGQTPYVSVEIVNGGRSPAWDVEVSDVQHTFSTFEKPQTLMEKYVPTYADIADINERIGILPASARHKFPFVPLEGILFNQEMIDDLKNKRASYFLIGEFKYNDLNGNIQVFPWVATYEVDEGKLFFESKWDKTGTRWDDKGRNTDS